MRRCPRQRSATPVVCDARYTTALAMIRSLGRAGLPVVAVERCGARGVLGFASRYATECRCVPAAEAGLLAALNAVAGPDHVLLPAGLKTLQLCVEHAGELRARTLLPEPEAFAAAADKARTLELAAQAGVPVPRRGGDSFPQVVKYRCGEALGLPAPQRYAICRSAAERDAAYAAMAARQPEPLVQEYLPGPGYGVSCLFDRAGEPVATFCHRRLREFPAVGGPSSLAESIADRELAELGERTLRALGWRGLAMVEFRAAADGRYRLLEVNPRPWGTLPLAIAAGVDFPLLWHRLAAGEGVCRQAGYRTGVRLRYAFKDLLSARAAGTGLGAFLADAIARPAVDAVFDPEDPLPGLVYLLRGLHG